MNSDSSNSSNEAKEHSTSPINVDTRTLDLVPTTSLNCSTIGGQDLKAGSIRGGSFEHLHFYRCTITGSDLTNCTVLECRLIDCTLYDSKITRSVVEKSTLKHSVGAVECLIEECRVRKSEFCECNIESSKIFHSKILGGQVTKSADVRHSSVVQSTISTSELSNCDVQQASATKSVFNESNVAASSTIGCSFTSSPLALRKFAPEIRDIIFRHVIEWNGKMPALIIALRGDHKLYHEALEILYSTCTFIRSERNNITITQMSQPAVESIRKLVLELGPYTFRSYVWALVATIPTNFHTAMCVTELKMIFHRKPSDNEISDLYMAGECWNLFKEACSSWLGKLGTVQTLSLEIYALNKRSIVTDDLTQKVLDLDMRWGIKRPRKLGKQARQDVPIPNCKVSWEANPGETLVWKWDTTPSIIANDTEW